MDTLQELRAARDAAAAKVTEWMKNNPTGNQNDAPGWQEYRAADAALRAYAVQQPKGDD